MSDEIANVQLFYGAGQPFQMAELPCPVELKAGEVLVRISLATICGSDLHSVAGRRDAPTPCILGHEGVGHVVSSNRIDVVVGRRVTWSLSVGCGHCQPCTRWQLPQKCQQIFKYGHAPLDDGSGLNGCYASHLLLRPGTQIYGVPESLSDVIVAPANCALATVVNALETLPMPCDRVLIQGAGLLGLYACAWLRQQGVAEIYCTDLSPARLAWVAEFGGIPLTGPQADRLSNLDLVFEVTGSSASIPAGVQVLRPGGHYLWAGMVHPQTKLDLTGEAIVKKCLNIRGVHNYAPGQLATGLEFLTRNQTVFPFEKLTSPAVPLMELNRGIELSGRRQWPRVSIKP